MGQKTGESHTNYFLTKSTAKGDRFSDCGIQKMNQPKACAHKETIIDVSIKTMSRLEVGKHMLNM
eukprot:TRINITY_DN9683_c0_g1_i1.p2 TRINITY_DN9683_c0_g1~~TRINITY_DN9683_c0_g1_i1.p2  ORF type:complete len:65 (+),score=9.37 TRINITY_DN9683_c0_g1_i1:332-526(+)